MTRTIVALAALGILTGRSAPQQPVFSSRVEMVRVDVLVTKDGHPVTDLRPEDFEVSDNGVLQQVTLVSLEEAPLDVVLTVDLSASVDGERLGHLRAAGRTLLDGLRPGDQAALIAFNHAVSRLRDLTSSVGEVRAALDRAAPAGGTALIDATFAGVVTGESDEARRGLVVIFSDGVDTSSWLEEDQVIESARRSRAIVYAVAVAQQRGGPPFLRDVSAVTGGRLLEVERTADLAGAFVAVLDEFRQRYLLSYAPRGVDAPGWHELDVRVRRDDTTVRARAGYFR
jgi:VWFA-related protein